MATAQWKWKEFVTDFVAESTYNRENQIMTDQDQNPFASPKDAGERLKGKVPVRTEGNRAMLAKSSLLYRKIDVEAPVLATIEYVGCTLRDKILVNGKLISWRLPIMGLSNTFVFEIPTETDAVPARIVVDVNIWLKLTTFLLEIQGETVYEESLVNN